MNLLTHHWPKLPLLISLMGWSNTVTSYSRTPLNARPSANQRVTPMSMFRFTTLRSPSPLREEMRTPFSKRCKMLRNCMTQSIWPSSIRRLASRWFRLAPARRRRSRYSGGVGPGGDVVRRRVLTNFIIGAICALLLGGLAGLSGGTYNTLMSPAVLPSCIGALVVAALSIGWWAAHARAWYPADAWWEFTKLDWVQQFLYVAFPMILLLVVASMAAHTFTLVARTWPSAPFAVHAYVYDKRHVRQKGACPYQVSI